MCPDRESHWQLSEWHPARGATRVGTPFLSAFHRNHGLRMDNTLPSQPRFLFTFPHVFLPSFPCLCNPAPLRSPSAGPGDSASSGAVPPWHYTPVRTPVLYEQLIYLPLNPRPGVSPLPSQLESRVSASGHVSLLHFATPRCCLKEAMSRSSFDQGKYQQNVADRTLCAGADCLPAPVPEVVVEHLPSTCILTGPGMGQAFAMH